MGERLDALSVILPPTTATDTTDITATTATYRYHYCYYYCYRYRYCYYCYYRYCYHGLLDSRLILLRQNPSLRFCITLAFPISRLDCYRSPFLLAVPKLEFLLLALLAVSCHPSRYLPLLALLAIHASAALGSPRRTFCCILLLALLATPLCCSPSSFFFDFF